LRFIGLIALTAAFAIAVLDGARTLADQKLEYTPLGITLAYALRDNFAQLPALAAKIHPKLWDPILIWLLYAPTFVALAIAGIVLMFLSRSREEEAIGARH
jgi:hypothetical protein